MTVAELIAELQKMPQDAEVQYFDLGEYSIANRTPNSVTWETDYGDPYVLIH